MKKVLLIVLLSIVILCSICIAQIPLWLPVVIDEVAHPCEIVR